MKPDEADKRAAIVREALSWVGTPFRDCADVKGRNGAVDCAMLLTRVYVDTGAAAPFDPRPYQPRHMLRRGADELFIKWIEELGGVEIAQPEIGDVVLWRYGWTFCHGGVLINRDEVCHAFAADGMCTVSRLDTPILKFIGHASGDIPRPVKYFSVIKPTVIPDEEARSNDHSQAAISRQ